MTDDEAHDFYSDPGNLIIYGPGCRREAPIWDHNTWVRFPPSLIQAIALKADAEGLTVSTWIRQLVQRALDQ